MASNAIASHIGWNIGQTYDSIACVIASMPVAAVSNAGSPTVSSGSSRASSGIIAGAPSTTLRPSFGTVITALRPTSLPVPAVVGIAQNGTSRLGT